MADVIREVEATPTVDDRARRFVWLAVAFLAIVGLIAAWMVFSEDDTPTITFDGEEAVYDGPTTFEPGLVDFHYDAAAYEDGVAIIIAQLTDDAITIEDVRADAAEKPASSPPPDYIGFFDITYLSSDVAKERVVDNTVRLHEDSRYLITANTSPRGSDTVFPAAIIEVE